MGGGGGGGVQSQLNIDSLTLAHYFVTDSILCIVAAI